MFGGDEVDPWSLVCIVMGSGAGFLVESKVN